MKFEGDQNDAEKFKNSYQQKQKFMNFNESRQIYCCSKHKSSKTYASKQKLCLDDLTCAAMLMEGVEEIEKLP
jgi:hypothetical protein